MADGSQRREKIMEILKERVNPVSGGEFAAMFGVSRQVIVQDIALLRAVNKDILATSKGYVIYHQNKGRCHRCVFVRHSAKEIRDELITIIENGGKVLDVVVDHDVYGQISADLILESVQDVDTFCYRLEHSQSKPLNVIADGDHMHTVEAASEVILDNIERALREEGYLRE